MSFANNGIGQGADAFNADAHGVTVLQRSDPAGVPVRMRSPGSRVMTAEIHSMIAPMSWIINDVRLSCRTPPLTSVRISRSDGSRSVTIHGPTGQKVS